MRKPLLQCCLMAFHLKWWCPKARTRPTEVSGKDPGVNGPLRLETPLLVLEGTHQSQCAGHTICGTAAITAGMVHIQCTTWHFMSGCHYRAHGLQSSSALPSWNLHSDLQHKFMSYIPIPISVPHILWIVTSPCKFGKLMCQRDLYCEVHTLQHSLS